jgi:hypothetical protein
MLLLAGRREDGRKAKLAWKVLLVVGRIRNLSPR